MFFLQGKLLIDIPLMMTCSTQNIAQGCTDFLKI